MPRPYELAGWKTRPHLNLVREAILFLRSRIKRSVVRKNFALLCVLCESQN